MKLIENIPLPISGLILALLSLGNLTQDISANLKCLFGSVAAAFLILITLKLLLYRENVKSDFENPVILSSFGTFSMSLMLLSTYLTGFNGSFAYGVWILGIALHIVIMIWFTYRFIVHNFDISNIYPSVWIVYVGITMAAITSPAYELTGIGFVFFKIGFISMLITTPAVIYRYLTVKNIPDANKPLICIFTAIFSILIVGYINSADIISKEFLTALYAIACIFYIFATVKLIQYIKLDFYPSFSAFTFPFVISALATKGVSIQLGFNSLISIILKIETAIAIIIVMYVLIRYLMFLKRISRN